VPQVSSSAKPADRNPMGLSADALDASAWKSESRTAAEASESRRLSASVDEVIAGVESPAKTLVSAPANFSWPVPEGML
jgi:hypothetical protein